MALYLGNGEKVSLTVSGKTYKPYMIVSKPNADSNKLLSFDNYILQDTNGLYLIPKESE